VNRRKIAPTDATGGDIHLEVVKTVVGILVILVMVVAARARQVTVEPELKVDVGLEQARRSVVDVESDVSHLASQIQAVDDELKSRKQQRELLATLMAAAEREFANHRATLDDASRVAYDVTRNLAMAKSDLERLERERARSEPAKPTSMKIESYPTPLAKPVDGKELHLQLLHGRVAIVPVDDLVARLKNTVQDKVWKLRDYPEMTDTVGPVDGFRMRYTLRRIDASFDSGRGGSYVQLDHWELVPVSEELGEPVAEALGPRSLLRAKLDTMSARDYTVTLWAYPDSFDAFRQLRKDLYERGYLVAGRPLPEDIPIGGSPHGTKSAAQ
jgi:hypothetical protein